MIHEVEHQGDPRHPEHAEYLTELGRAVYAAATVAGIAIDILRTHHEDDYFDLVGDTMGALTRKVRTRAEAGSPVPKLAEFADELERVTNVRNDLIHALPVLNGLHRRTAKDMSRVVNFFSADDLRAVTADFHQVRRTGSSLLYYPGGAAVRPD